MRRLFALAVLLALLPSCASLFKIAHDVSEGNKPKFEDVKQVGKDVADTGKEMLGDVKDASKDLTAENEYFVGRSTGANILSRSDFKYLDPVGELGAYVSYVGYTLAASAEELRTSDHRPAPLGGWHFVIVDTETANAIGAPGGFVFVTRGALKVARTEDELAAVLAHELAHVMRGHGLGQIKADRFNKVSGKWLKKGVNALTHDQVSALAESMSGGLMDMNKTFFVSGYARGQELSADELGQAIAARAGYDPSAMQGFLETLGKVQATSSGGLGTTHPSNAERIEKLRGNAKEIKDKAKAAGHAAAPERTTQRTTRFLAATNSVR